MYKLERYNNRKNNKKFRCVLTILIIILILLITYIAIQLNKAPSRPLFNESKAKTTQLKINNEVQDWKVIEEAFQDECKKQNELVVLEGTRKIKKVYSNTHDEIAYKTGNPMSFLFDKLNEWKTRYIAITTSYNYLFVYNMNDINISIDEDGIATIKLYRGEVSLKPIAENPADRVLEDEGGWLSHKFSPQETGAILGRTQLHTYNNIVNDNDLYEKALNNTKDNIEELALKLGVKSAVTEIYNIAALENSEVAVLEDSQINK